VRDWCFDTVTSEPHNSRLVAGRRIAALALFALAAAVGLPQAMAQQAAPPAQAAGAKESAPAAEFDVLEFFVDGNSVLTAATIENAVYPFMGEKRSIADVQNARAALEAAYRDRGYLGVSVLIPQQQVKDGVVRLEVVEAKVARTRVKDAQYTSPAWVREQLPSVAEGTVPNFNSFETELVGLNRMNLLTATPLLRPGTEAGVLDVDVLVEDRKPWALIVDLNNNAAVNTKPLRLGMAASYNNLFGLRHSLGAQFVVSPQDTSQVKLGTVSYSAPMGGPNDATLSARR
jgi:hemolysin activation/secretion protein